MNQNLKIILSDSDDGTWNSAIELFKNSKFPNFRVPEKPTVHYFGRGQAELHFKQLQKILFSVSQFLLGTWIPKKHIK